MTSIELTSYLSLAYQLGSPLVPAENQEALYGVKPGEQVRGQNLKVLTAWRSHPEVSASDLFKLCRDRTKTQLKEWDHIFLSPNGKLGSQALTLENISYELAQKFAQYQAPVCQQVEVQQDKWRVKVVPFAAGAAQLSLFRKFPFQSLIRQGDNFQPVDLQLEVEWRGELDRSTGLLQPWQVLRKSVASAYESIRQEQPEFFNTPQLVQFLKAVVEKIKGNDSTGMLASVRFKDLKDHYEIALRSPEDFS